MKFSFASAHYRTENILYQKTVKYQIFYIKVTVKLKKIFARLREMMEYKALFIAMKLQLYRHIQAFK